MGLPEASLVLPRTVGLKVGDPSFLIDQQLIFQFHESSGLRTSVDYCKLNQPDDLHADEFQAIEQALVLCRIPGKQTDLHL